MEKPEENVVNAGLIFMFSVWLQGQMSDLTILKKNPALVQEFVANPKRVPAAFHKIRVEYWEKLFSDVKNEFTEAFAAELTEEDLQEIEEIFHLRNMIAHAHVSFGREYMLYRPSGNHKERAVIETLKPSPVEDQADPIIFKLDFINGDLFNRLSVKIGRLDQVCFARLAASIEIPHSRIR